MGISTDIETIKSAKNHHRCSWCNGRIDAGTGYSRYRFYDGGDAGTVKLHPECFEASLDLEREDTFRPGDNPRGCSCGFSAGCENCADIKLRLNL
jgi:hypothetical protein